MPYKDTISKSAQNVYSAGTCTLSASTHAGYATRMFEAHLSPATTVDSHSTWHTNLYPYSFTLHRLHRVQGVPHVATCYGPHAVCRMPHATSRVLCVQLLSRRLSTQIVPISVNKMLTFSLKLRSTQLDMPPTQAQTHTWARTQTHTHRDIRRHLEGEGFASLASVGFTLCCGASLFYYCLMQFCWCWPTLS